MSLFHSPPLDSPRQKVARPPMYSQTTSEHQTQLSMQHKHLPPHHHSKQQVHTKSKHHHSLSIQDLNLNLRDSAGQQSTLLSLFKVYAILVISLAVIYALYHFCQQSYQLRLQHQHADSSSVESTSFAARPTADSQSAESSNFELAQADSTRKQQELEQKVQLLQRYVELIAADLKDTRDRLREREKCRCSQGCRFNDTSYADGSSWQQQCETCACQSGKISCTPLKCPQPNCDDPIQVPGQCCPVCMKSCRYNQTTIRHGQMLTQTDPSKECRCVNGLIKCLSARLKESRGPKRASSSNAANKIQLAASSKSDGHG